MVKPQIECGQSIQFGPVSISRFTVCHIRPDPTYRVFAKQSFSAFSAHALLVELTSVLRDPAALKCFLLVVYMAVWWHPSRGCIVMAG